MNIVFNNMIKMNNEIVGTPVEGGKVFSTRNSRGRKIISKFSVLSDEKIIPAWLRFSLIPTAAGTSPADGYDKIFLFPLCFQAFLA